MSSAPSVNDTLNGYLAGRVTAAQLSAIVAAAYFREAGNGKREAWQPIMDVVERAHPGVVELTATHERPGFTVRLAERPFPKKYEVELRQAVERVVGTHPASRFPLPEKPAEKPGLFRRLVAAVRKLFGA